ncbi:CHC2 zinc finger domain-containing protein [Sphingomonas montana]|uniref:CHC2 zinc finger domain-containing protein n=1 Tax=Sphingomonas montana TaxID=1843236 RepID=UPI00096D4195|nr:CHC2 zinc finger domain-containing protein [Sphingomonas montana]
MNRPRLDPDAFRRAIGDAKGRHLLSEIIGRKTALKKRGPREMVGLCPFHVEKSPSFEVNDDKGTYHCWGCGAVGDAMTFLMKAEGLSFRDALQSLAGDTFPVISDENRTRRKQEAAATTARRIRAGQDCWRRAVPSEGTAAEAYIRYRGITAPLPDTVRFAELDYRDQETGTVIASRVPVMVCALQDASGSVVGVQRIYLAQDGRGKLDVPKPKMSLGIIVGSAFRATGHDLGSATQVIGCEGPEDGLTLAQEITGRPVLVACGTALLSRLDLPPQVREIMLAGDNNAAGRTAVEQSRAVYLDRGIDVVEMYPADGFKDYNDQLRGVRM